MAELCLSLGKQMFQYTVGGLFDEDPAAPRTLTPVVNERAVKSGEKAGSRLSHFVFEGGATGLFNLSQEETKEMYRRCLLAKEETIKVPLAGSSSSIHLYKGVTVLMGGSGAGKTVLSSYIARRLNGDADDGFPARCITYCEPELVSATGEPTVTEERDLISSVASFLVGTEAVLDVDSLRELMYSSSGGATGKGGINMTIFSILTKWDLLAQLLGKVVILNVNPLNVTEDVLEQFREAASGSVTSVLNLPSINNIEFTSRDVKWRSRVWKALKGVDIGRLASYDNPGQIAPTLGSDREVEAIPLLGRNNFIPEI